jgi:hypothetical protein
MGLYGFIAPTHTSIPVIESISCRIVAFRKISFNHLSDPSLNNWLEIFGSHLPMEQS